jgi:hypothetical protein
MRAVRLAKGIPTIPRGTKIALYASATLRASPYISGAATQGKSGTIILKSELVFTLSLIYVYFTQTLICEILGEAKW